MLQFTGIRSHTQFYSLPTPIMHQVSCTTNRTHRRHGYSPELLAIGPHFLRLRVRTRVPLVITGLLHRPAIPPLAPLGHPRPPRVRLQVPLLQRGRLRWMLVSTVNDIVRQMPPRPNRLTKQNRLSTIEQRFFRPLKRRPIISNRSRNGGQIFAGVMTPSAKWCLRFGKLVRQKKSELL